MFIAAISFAVLLLTMTLIARRTKPVAHVADNVISLDAYRASRLDGRLDGRATNPAPVEPVLAYPLMASAGGWSSATGGGLRTCRQPDGRLGRPTARIEPV